jgi:hypothetical protein
LVAGAVLATTGLGLRVAVHEFPGFGTAVADGVRNVVGPGPVAWAEDVVYGLEDFVNVSTKSDEAPTTFWEDASTPEPVVVVTESGERVVVDPLEGAPPKATVLHEKVAGPSDGVWSPLRAPSDERRVVMWRTQLHPDPKRPFTAVAVVAADLSEVELGLVAGTEEPKSQQVLRSERPGLVPGDAQDRLLAAFNGGFKAMHGNYGMKLGGKTFIPPRDIGCTLFARPDGHLGIRTFSEVKGDAGSFPWYRQTPPCLIENGEPNPGLLHEFNKNWGAAVGGDTIIRRSAIGLSADGRYLFFGLGESTTAQSIGRAMQAAGAHHAAQLDVNYIYPRFFLFEHGDTGPSMTGPLIPDLKFSPGEYVRTPANRDFFYLARKSGRSASSGRRAPSSG